VRGAHSRTVRVRQLVASSLPVRADRQPVRSCGLWLSARGCAAVPPFQKMISKIDNKSAERK